MKNVATYNYISFINLNIPVSLGPQAYPNLLGARLSSPHEHEFYSSHKRIESQKSCWIEGPAGRTGNQGILIVPESSRRHSNFSNSRMALRTA